MRTFTKLYKNLNTLNVSFQPHSLRALFQKLDVWLAKHQALWDVQSFHHLNWPWQSAYPELCHWLSAQEHLNEVDVLNALSRYVTGFEEFLLPDFKTLEQAARAAPPSSFSAGMKGRKWQQIEAFSNQVSLTSPVIEWCAGKGHLGKLLAYQHSVQVHSLEWQQSLCDAGQQAANKLGLNQQFTKADVLKGEGRAALVKARSAVALHACGDLHTTLIEQGIAAQLTDFAIVPCCYHLTQHPYYQPLSKAAQQAKTKLSQENLKLAVKEVVTAGQREQRLKELELSYRLGFDAWQRQVTGRNQYMNVPSCSKALLNDGFEAFCVWAAEQKGLSQHLTNHPVHEFTVVGNDRAKHVAKIEAVTQSFRRPLELWLVLDRALRLEEAGYQVRISEFCDKTLTPRNFMILAHC